MGYTTITAIIMLKYTVVLILLTAGVIPLCYGQTNSCPYVTAADGSSYDLRHIANRVYQFPDDSGLNNNLSICSPIPHGCAGPCLSPNSAGVCQYWGPGPSNAECWGSFKSSEIIGYNNGLGVQITYKNGDICNSCNPSGPRQTVITLGCVYDTDSDPSKIRWRYGRFPGRGDPPVAYVNGFINCGPSNVNKR